MIGCCVFGVENYNYNPVVSNSTFRFLNELLDSLGVCPDF